MASIFITGSADGLGKLAAQRLAALGHDVVLQTAVVIALFGFAVALAVFRPPRGLPVAQLAEETTA